MTKNVFVIMMIICFEIANSWDQKFPNNMLLFQVAPSHQSHYFVILSFTYKLDCLGGSREKVFEHRDSLLTELFKISHIRTLRHIFISVLIIICFQIIIFDLTHTGRFIEEKIKELLLKIFISLLILIALILILIYGDQVLVGSSILYSTLGFPCNSLLFAQ